MTNSRLCCRGCGWEAPWDEPYPFRCARAGGGDIDHVLRRTLEPAAIADAKEIFARGELNPFLRYRELLHVYQLARANGMADGEWRDLVESLDAAVRDVDGRGFRSTPCENSPGLAEALGTREVWIKNESGNVSGSHKGRHLMGVLLWLEAGRRLRLVEPGEEGPLAIASCGNAALAAAVVARAGGRRLEVFVPTHANPGVVDSLTRLDARLHTCPRREGERGDPCYLRFREALADGALPFTCQGNENGLTLDGGKTLAWEMVTALQEAGAAIDRLVLHVGGGALATSVIEGLREARDVGVLPRLPTIHAVQTTGAFPLVRAYRHLSGRILDEWSGASSQAPPEGEADRAACLATAELAPFVEAGLEYAVTHRSEFMWPWEQEPASIADGILDDETYDWMAVLEGMLETAGWPLVASEESLLEANRLARRVTGIKPCYTGTAGLAGAITLQAAGSPAAGERMAIVVSGVDRG